MDKLIEKHIRSKKKQDERRVAANHDDLSDSGVQINVPSQPGPSKKRKAPVHESEDEELERQPKISRPRSLSPDDVRVPRGEVVDIEEDADYADVPERYSFLLFSLRHLLDHSVCRSLRNDNAEGERSDECVSLYDEWELH